MKPTYLIGCTLAAVLFAGTANAEELTGTLKNIKDSGAITLGFRDSSIPFSYLDDNQKPVGFAMAQSVSELLTTAFAQAC